jgi:C4-dicarboxylate-binding protein DctP
MKLTKLLIGAIAMSISAMSYAADDQIVLKFSHVVAPNTPKGLAADYFAKKAAELTKGRVKVEVYPNSKLYKDKEEMDALAENKVQILAPSLAKFSSYERSFEMFDLPYLFDNQDQLNKITNGRVGKDLLKKLEPKGFIGLAYWDNGFKSFSGNTKLVKPNDFKGKIFRVQPSKVLEDQMAALLARPVVMAFSEVYPALQTGVVDGAENPISNIYTQNMHEVQKYLTISNHGYLGYAVIVNKSYWNGLPADIREQLETAMKDATEYERKIADEQNSKALESIKASGKTKIYYMTQSEKDELKKVFVPVYKNMENKVGKAVMEDVYKELGK